MKGDHTIYTILVSHPYFTACQIESNKEPAFTAKLFECVLLFQVIQTGHTGVVVNHV